MAGRCFPPFSTFAPMDAPLIPTGQQKSSPPVVPLRNPRRSTGPPVPIGAEDTSPCSTDQPRIPARTSAHRATCPSHYIFNTATLGRDPAVASHSINIFGGCASSERSPARLSASHPLLPSPRAT
ncbi:hypothetical protein CGRA01v4_07479 [Colletotrichum graminicola]|nr:hypothetical protein CGRA01v4_07479 [Colletotrichum graminicola]